MVDDPSEADETRFNQTISEKAKELAQGLRKRVKGDTKMPTEGSSRTRAHDKEQSTELPPKRSPKPKKHPKKPLKTDTDPKGKGKGKGKSPSSPGKGKGKGGNPTSPAPHSPISSFDSPPKNGESPGGPGGKGDRTSAYPKWRWDKNSWWKTNIARKGSYNVEKGKGRGRKGKGKGAW